MCSLHAFFPTSFRTIWPDVVTSSHLCWNICFNFIIELPDGETRQQLKSDLDFSFSFVYIVPQSQQQFHQDAPYCKVDTTLIRTEKNTIIM